MKNTVIELKNVSMQFDLNIEKVNSLKEYLIKYFKRELKFEKMWALKEINLKVLEGDVLGIVGFNGAGKSTLLKVISGILKPTTGEVKIDGNISPLIELGAGFDMDLTARENIFLNGYILGYSKKLLKEKYNEIIEFSELREFMDVPLKNFSSGMVARLGFAIATIIEPKILIVDEILSVGDFKFQQKSERKIKNMMGNGITVIFVSHSIDQVEEICNKVVWLEKGKIKKIGNAKEICEEYRNS
ncbi:ABC transporter ATP-binding protein [Leptotrichia buccalis]|jgi:O-antigen export system ATP-binding protein rfbB